MVMALRQASSTPGSLSTLSLEPRRSRALTVDGRRRHTAAVGLEIRVDRAEETAHMLGSTFEVGNVDLRDPSPGCGEQGNLVAPRR
jgi:hypothetical protein